MRFIINKDNLIEGDHISLINGKKDLTIISMNCDPPKSILCCNPEREFIYVSKDEISEEIIPDSNSDSIDIIYSERVFKKGDWLFIEDKVLESLLFKFDDLYVEDPSFDSVILIGFEKFKGFHSKIEEAAIRLDLNYIKSIRLATEKEIKHLREYDKG